MHSILIIELVYLFVVFPFICSVKCTAGEALPAGVAFDAVNEYKKCTETVNKHTIYGCIASIAMVKSSRVKLLV